MTLTLGNYNGQWYYRAQSQPGGDANGASAASGASDCTGPADGTHAQATGLDPDTTYTFTAYTNTGCTQQIAQASAQTGSTAAPSLTVGDVTRSSATLTIDGHSGNWHYKANWGPHSSCSAAVAASTASLSGLSTATHYVYVAYSDAQCSTRLASAEFATSPRYANHPSLEVNEGTLTFDSVTLDPYPWGSSWWYKSDKAPHGSGCNGPVVDAAPLAVTGLAPATAYTYTMYDYSDCETDMAEISFTTSALPAVTLETSNLNGHRVILTPKGFSRSWYYENSSICTGPVGPGGVTINLPLPGHEYTYAAHAYAGCEASSQLGDAITFQAPYPTLGVESFNAWGGQLTLTGWDKAWYYYEDLDGVVGNNVCKSVPAGTSTALINLKPGQRYKYVTLRSLHGGCAALGYSLGPPGQVTFTAPQLSASTTATTAELTLTNWSAPWYYQQSLSGSPFGACSGPVTPVSGTGTATITGLTASSTYDYKVYKDGSCRYKSVIDIVRFTTATPGLSIAPHNPDNPNGWYRISISGWDADWWVKETFTNTLGCSKVNAGGTKDIKESAFGAVYRFFRAYSASGCDAANQLATVELRRIERDTLTASNITGDTATLSLKLLDKDYPGLWYVRQISPTTGPCSPGTAISQPHALDGLTPVTQHTYKAYTAFNCHSYFERATVKFTTTEGLLLSDLTSTGATLTMGGHSGNWWLKRTSPADTACNAKTTATENLTGLTPGRTYTYTAYRDSSCTNQLGSSITFTTLTLTAGRIAATKATLTLNQHDGNWWLKRTSPADTACNAKTTATENLTGLTPGITYTYTAYRDSSCTSVLAAGTFTTLSMAAGSLTATTATLTLNQHSGDWYYEADAGPDTSCQGPISTSTADVAWLNPSTQYTYTAYRDSGCTDTLATATFTTLSGLGPKLSTPDSVTVTYTSKQLNVSWDAVTGATGYLVQSRVATDDNSNTYTTPSAGTCSSAVTATSCTITGLVNGTSYDVQVRATRATNLPSDWSDAVTQAPSTLPGDPTSVSASASKGGVSVTWTAPSDNGGSPITSAEIRTRTTSPQGSWSDAVTAMGDAATSPARIIGLTAGTQYDVQLRVRNVNGESGWVDAGSATPLTTTKPAGKVQNVSVTYSDSKIWIRFDHPSDDGGLPLQFEFTSGVDNVGVVATRSVRTVAGTEADKTHNGTTYDAAYYITEWLLPNFGWYSVCHGAQHLKFKPNVLVKNSNGNGTWYNHTSWVVAPC